MSDASIQQSLADAVAHVRAGLERLESLGVEYVHRTPGARPAPEPASPVVAESANSEAPVTRTAASAGAGPTTAADPGGAREAPGFPAHGAESLEQVRTDLGECRRCKLWETRTKLVFGEGNPKARVVFVGEGPGREEDLQGRPFVGRAGQLLTDIIEKGMGFRREDVYICNVVKSRPTVNMEGKKDRPPEPDEVAACGPFLLRQLRAINPEVIVTLGNPSTKFLLDTTQGITKLRGHWHEWEGIAVMPTFHPAYLLRNAPEKRKTWEDIKLVLERLSLPVPGASKDSK